MPRHGGVGGAEYSSETSADCLKALIDYFRVHVSGVCK